MGNSTNQQRIEANKQDVESLKELLPTQMQTEISPSEDRMEEKLMSSQENLKDSLGTMFMHGQNLMQETF